jgi:hypothetical protein
LSEAEALLRSLKKPSCVKLSTLVREPRLEPCDASNANGTFGLNTETVDPIDATPEGMHPLERFQQKEHLLCLNQQEALMLFGLLQAVSRHEPTRQTMLSCGDYKQFHRQLTHSLAQSLAGSTSAA